MTLQLYRLLFDFGLLVLIWIVQLVVYPSFRYYQREQLIKWHKKYTAQITYVVFPLMLGQLLWSGLQLLHGVSWYTSISFLVVILLWISTFLQFIPLHNKISREDFNDDTTLQLVQKNWLRTVGWTGLFVISLLHTQTTL